MMKSDYRFSKWCIGFILAAALFIPDPVFAITKRKVEDPAKIKAECQRMHGSLQKKVGRTSTIEDLDNPPLLRRFWLKTIDFVVAYLNMHPTATAQSLQQELKGLNLNGSILPFHYRATDGFVIAVSDDVAGTCFVVAGSPGKPFDRIWHMAADTLNAFPHGGSWSESVEKGRPGVYPSVGSLPETADGHPRFYTRSYYSRANGTTVSVQLIVWEWDGKGAKPLIADDYSVVLESKHTEVSFKDNILTIATKEWPKTFFVTGPEEEPEGLWSIKIGPNRVENLGRRYAIPELQFLDELFYRIQRHEPVADMTSQAVTAKIVTMISTANQEKDSVLLGEMWGWRRTPTEHGFWVCLDIDEPGPLEYRIEYKSGKPYVTEIRDPVDPTTLQGLSYDKSSTTWAKEPSKCR